MTGVVDTLVSGIIKSAMDEILRKTGVKPSSTTKRTKRKTRGGTTSSRTGTRKSGPVSGSAGRGSRSAPTPTAKKQVSKRRTSLARSKTKRRGY